jgi:hypothetical protein
MTFQTLTLASLGMLTVACVLAFDVEHISRDFNLHNLVRMCLVVTCA